MDHDTTTVHSSLIPEEVAHFHDHIKEIRRAGLSALDVETSYVTRQDIEDYWDYGDIQRVLDHINLRYLEESIRTKYLLVFSTLFYMDKIGYLPLFVRYKLTDDYWPRDDFPSVWPDPFREFFSHFRDTHWTFFPHQFAPDDAFDQILPLHCILPLDSKIPFQPYGSRPSNDVDSARLFRIEVNECCQELIQRSNGKTFILKSYQKRYPDQRKAYEFEKGAYVMLQSSGPSPHTVTLYASFEQHEFLHLLLEFVDGINLEEYLKDPRNPQQLNDIHDFWTSVLGFFSGLHKIHQLSRPYGNSSPFAIIYQDIKPDNILLVREEGSMYKFHVKLVDFGHSTVVKLENDDEEAQGPDHRGNPTYSAPENTQHTQDLEEGSAMTTRKADIFGAGGIMLQLACWVAGGVDMVETFLEVRYEELSYYPKFRLSGYMDGHHNGDDVLAAIEQCRSLIRNMILEKDRDTITPRFLDIVVREMLGKHPGDRSSAKNLRSSFENILEDCKPSIDKDSKMPFIRITDDMNRDGRLKGEACSLTLEQILIYQEQELRATPSMSNASMRRIKGKLDQLKKNLGDRDHIFLIDNSPSMQQHKPELNRALQALLFVAKGIDPALELVLASEPTIIHKSKNISDLMGIMGRCKFDQEAGLMEDRLGTLSKKAIIPKLKALASPNSIFHFGPKKPISLFILTDGCWGHDLQRAAGVQTPIKELVKHMKAEGVARTKVTIQFLKFGDDEEGKRYLKYLDEMGRKEELDGFDIVDTTSVDDDVYHMFMGSITEKNDRRREST